MGINTQGEGAHVHGGEGGHGARGMRIIYCNCFSPYSSQPPPHHGVPLKRLRLVINSLDFAN